MSSEIAQARVLVAIATYNERDNLGPLVREVHAVIPVADILVIDDNSPDGTGVLAAEMAAADPRIHVLHRPAKLGLGTALLAGMRYAQEQNYDLLVTMDGDFSHSPRYLPALLRGMARYDVMIGSRYVAGGGTVNWPKARKIISRTVNTVVRVLMRVPARDSSAAYRCYRVSKLRETNLSGLISTGYSFLQEVLYRCRKAGCRIGETPIVFENRRAGASKVDLREAVRSLTAILRLGVGELFGVEPRGLPTFPSPSQGFCESL